MRYKVVYDRTNCIGANSCVGVFPDFWSLDGTKKAVLKGATFNEASGRHELLISDKDLERFMESAQVCPVFVIDIVDTQTDKSVLNPGQTAEVHKESAPVIQAKAAKAGEFGEDPKGYFTIRAYPEEGLIKVWYYGPRHQLLFILEGRSAAELYGAIAREGFVGSFYHAAQLGSELQKAEIAVKKKLAYRQDEPLA